MDDHIKHNFLNEETVIGPRLIINRGVILSIIDIKTSKTVTDIKVSDFINCIADYDTNNILIATAGYLGLFSLLTYKQIKLVDIAIPAEMILKYNDNVVLVKAGNNIYEIETKTGNTRHINSGRDHIINMVKWGDSVLLLKYGHITMLYNYPIEAEEYIRYTAPFASFTGFVHENAYVQSRPPYIEIFPEIMRTRSQSKETLKEENILIIYGADDENVLLRGPGRILILNMTTRQITKRVNINGVFSDLLYKILPIDAMMIRCVVHILLNKYIPRDIINMINML